GVFLSLRIRGKFTDAASLPHQHLRNFFRSVTGGWKCQEAEGCRVLVISANPGDRSLFSGDESFGQGEVPKRRCLALPWPEHPCQESPDCTPLGILSEMGRNHEPGEGCNWVRALAWSVHNRLGEVIANLRRVVYCRLNGLQAGLDEFAVLIANPAVS